MKLHQIEALATKSRQVTLALTFTQPAKTFIHYFTNFNGTSVSFKSEFDLNTFINCEAPKWIALGQYWNYTGTDRKEATV
jgi:hypothetical protein